MIVIKKSKTADTRSADVKVTKEQLLASSEQHIDDVKLAMSFFIEIIFTRAQKHDWTKLDGIKQFHYDFKQTQKTGCDFTKLPWYQRHISEERHHLNNRVPDDVNLFDVLERVADIVMAGMGRTGTVYPDHLPPDVLEKAYQNTVELLKREVKVE